MNNEEYKNKLMEEKNVIESSLKDIGQVVDKKTGDWEAVPQVMETESDENDLADKFEDFNERSAKLSTLEGRLNDIKAALEKIEKGEFGKCEICGKNIESDRLTANPAARTCMEHMN